MSTSLSLAALCMSHEECRRSDVGLGQPSNWELMGRWEKLIAIIETTGYCHRHGGLILTGFTLLIPQYSSFLHFLQQYSSTFFLNILQLSSSIFFNISPSSSFLYPHYIIQTVPFLLNWWGLTNGDNRGEVVGGLSCVSNTVWSKSGPAMGQVRQMMRGPTSRNVTSLANEASCMRSKLVESSSLE